MKPLTRAAVMAGLLLSTTISLGATAATNYAVLSLIGDSMTVVTYAVSVGSRLDKNVREAVPLKDPVFDRAAAKAVEQGLQKVDSQNKVTILAASSPELFNNQRKLFDGSKLALDGDVAASLRRDGATHMVVVTKHRADARLGSGWSAGSGSLEGIGFYIDPDLSIESNITGGDPGQGFVAPYAYVKLSLVDLASSTVVREQVVTASKMVARPRSESRNAWSMLSADEKATMLRTLMVGEIERAVPSLVAGRS